MTDIRVDRVLTAIVDNDFRYARTAEEIAELVRLVVDVPHPDWASLLYLWDRPCRSGLRHGGEGAYPEHQLRVFTDPVRGWGAVNFVDTEDASDSRNPFPGDAPALPFDPSGGSFFPASATVSLDLVRTAVSEFAMTGRRPHCLSWQQARLI